MIATATQLGNSLLTGTFISGLKDSLSATNLLPNTDSSITDLILTVRERRPFLQRISVGHPSLQVAFSHFHRQIFDTLPSWEKPASIQTSFHKLATSYPPNDQWAQEKTINDYYLSLLYALLDGLATLQTTIEMAPNLLGFNCADGHAILNGPQPEITLDLAVQHYCQAHYQKDWPAFFTTLISSTIEMDELDHRTKSHLRIGGHMWRLGLADDESWANILWAAGNSIPPHEDMTAVSIISLYAADSIRDSRQAGRSFFRLIQTAKSLPAHSAKAAERELNELRETPLAPESVG